MDTKEFLNPGRPYRGVALWMLNDKLEAGEIARQLDGIAEAGWGAVIARTFVGLRTQYLSDEWMAITDQVVRGCRRHGMKAWLQAGQMPSAIPDLAPEITHQVLIRRPKDAPSKESDTVLAQDDALAYVQQPLPNVLDLLDTAAVTQYLEDAYKRTWADRFGDEFGKTLEAVWVDEPHFRPPPLPWSRRLPARFQQEWGYAITDHLPSLFATTGDYRKVRHHYWRTVTAMFVEAYFQGVGEWCGQNRLKFAGHLMGEDTLNNQIAWTGSTMAAYEHMHLPGIDHLTRSLCWPADKKFLLTPKQVSSAAHQTGRKEILCEVYGVSSHSISFEDRKAISEWMFVLGVNYRCYHGYFYSMRGRRKRVYVPHLSYQQPWWGDNRLIGDYFGRLSYAMRQGEFLPEVLVLHPVESIYCIYDPLAMERPHDRTTELPEMKVRDDELNRLMDHLLKIHRAFELGDETLIVRHGKVAGRLFRVGKMAYKAVVLPSLITIRATTLEMLKKFAAAGGKVFSIGELPTRVDGAADERAGELGRIVTPVANDPRELRAALDAAFAPQVEVASEPGGLAQDVWVHARKVPRGRLFYLTNTSRLEGGTVQVRIPGRGRLQEWNCLTGKVSDAPQRAEGDSIVCELALAPLGSRLLMLDEKARPTKVAAARPVVTREFPLGAKGAVRRLAPNALTLDRCRYRKGQGAWSDELPIIRVQEILEKEEYRGPLTVRLMFHVEAAPKRLQAAIEDAAQYRIEVNGRAVGHDDGCRGLPASAASADAATTAVVAADNAANHGTDAPYFVDRSFHTVDIAAQVRQGENTLDLFIDFQPVPKATFALASLFEVRTGTELESVYLIGDFALAGVVSPRTARAKCIRYEKRFSLTREKAARWGDLSAAGYPFYAGRSVFQDAVALPKRARGERVILELGSLDGALAKVRVNGRDAGAILWAPYEVDITDFAKAGRNNVEIEVAGTLRNLLGPHHRSLGESDACWSTAFNYTPPGGSVEHAEEAEGAWTDDYFVVHFGLRGGASVKYVCKE